MSDITIARLVKYAADHPIRPGHPLPARFDEWSCYVASRHVLLMVCEWSHPHEQMMYHASISHGQGHLEPSLAVVLEVLMCIEELLGAPAFFAMGENIVHFFWTFESESGEEAPPAATTH